MKYKNINYLEDYLLVSSFCEIQKTADEGLFSTLKDQLINALPKDSKSITNFLAPSIVYQIISSLTGARWVGVVIGILMSTFKIDVYSILEKICSEIKSLIVSGVKPTEDKIVDIINSHMPQIPKTASIKIAELYIYGKEETELDRISREVLRKITERGHTNIPARLISLLWAFFRFFFITSLGALGFMAAGNLVSSFIGDKSESKPEQPQSQVQQTQQTNKKENKKIETHHDEWMINKSNTLQNIENFVIDSTIKTYPNLSENEIISTSAFKAIVKHISYFNSNMKGFRAFFIPKNYKSIKDIADKIKNDID